MSHFAGHVLGSLIAKAIRDSKPERRVSSTTFVRFGNQDQEAGYVGPEKVSPLEVEDPLNPICCSCFGLKSTIRTLGYVQLVLASLGFAALLYMISNHVDSELSSSINHSFYYWPALAGGYAVLLWVSWLYIIAAVLLVQGVKWGKKGYLDLWMVLNISGLFNCGVCVVQNLFLF